MSPQQVPFMRKLILLRYRFGQTKLGRWLLYVPKVWYIRFLSRIGLTPLRPIDDLPETDYKYKLSVYTRVYNEGRFIREFIAFHLAVGVEHFYIYDNASTDNTAEQIKPFVDAGLVTLISYPKKPPSPEADIHCMTSFRKESKWIACIDADEFLFPLKGDSLLDVLDKFKDEAGVGVCWQYFGSSHHKDRPEGLVIENYTYCSPGVVETLKSIVNPRRVIQYGNPHYWIYGGGEYAVDEYGRHLKGGASQSPSGDRLRINHYHCKSEEDYLEKTDPSYYADKFVKLGRTRTSYNLSQAFHSHNDVENTDIWRFKEKTEEILESFPVVEGEIAESRELKIEESAQYMRNKNIKVSIFVSMFSKFVGVGIQFWAIPYASHEFGPLFGVYMAIATIMNVISTANFGIGPGITQALSTFATDRNEEEERSWFAGAFALVFVSALVLFVIALGIWLAVPMHKIFGAEFVNFEAPLKRGFISLVIVASLLNIVSIFDFSYIGYLEDYKLKYYTFAGFVLSIGAIFWVVANWPTVTGLLLAVFGVPLLPRFLGAYNLMFVNRPYLKFSWVDVTWEKIKRLLSSNLAHTTMQLGELAMNAGGMLIVSNTFGVRGSGQLGALLSWIAMVITLRTMIINPVWPGMRNAWQEKDYKWAKNTFIKAWGVMTIMGVVAAILFATVGQMLFNRLFDAQYGIDQASMIALGVAGIISFTEALFYYVFIAIDRIWVGSLSTLFRGLCAFTIAYFMIPRFGVSGFFWAMSIGLTLSTIVMVIFARKELKLILSA